jgi:hypothetical protein
MTLTQRQSNRRRQRRFRHYIEALEARWAPALLVVNSLVDTAVDLTDATVTLRDAIHAANNDLRVAPGESSGSGADEIQFQSGLSGTIPLHSGELLISSDLIITGPGANLLTIRVNVNTFTNLMRLFNVDDGTATIRAVTLSGMTIRDGNPGGFSDGGGIFNAENLTVQSCTLSNNFATNGGGIFNSGTLTVQKSTLNGNLATNGGGIFNDVDGAVTVQNSTLSGNEARFGEAGGILNHGTLTVQNSTLSGNSASLDGGAILNFSTLTVRNSTLTKNRIGFADLTVRGAGIFSSPGSTSSPTTVTLHNTIVAENVRFTFTQDDVHGSVHSTSTNNLIGVDTGLSGISDGTNGNQIGTASTRIDPRLESLADNGGPGQTHALSRFSTAIDGGNNAEVPAGMNSDQRGSPFVRIANTTVDIGAYEVQPLSISLVVDTTAEEDDGDFSAGDLSLREAIRLSNGGTGADTITFSPSVFGTPQIITLRGTELLIADELNINGPGAGLLTISGNNASRIFKVEAVNKAGEYPVTLSGLSVTGGNAGSDPGVLGGGVLHVGGVLTIQNSTLSGNTAGHGGGIASLRRLTVQNSTVSGNAAQFRSGGGIYSLGGWLNVQNSTVSGNTAHSGGGIYAERAFELIVQTSIVSGNRARYGGGILIFNDNFGQNSVQNCTVSDNTADDSGGGIMAVTAGEVFPFTVANTTLSGNTAGGFGGGIFNGSDFEHTYGFQIKSVLFVQNSILSGNSSSNASNGAGIYNRDSIATVQNSTLGGHSGVAILNQGDGARLTVQNSTLSGNSFGAIRNLSNGTATLQNSTVSGNRGQGGIFSQGPLTVLNSTITQNHVEGPFSDHEGGGIGNLFGTLTLHNTVVADNFRGSGTTNRDDLNGTVENSSTNNLIGVDTGLSGISDGANGNQIGTAAAPIDPQLGPLADNGGPTLTHALLSSSPAIDGGNNADVPADMTTDQRGGSYARIIHNTVDIGAYEVQSVNEPPVVEANGPYSVAEGASVVLSSSGSSDADGSIVLFEWDFDYDGVTFTVDAIGPSPVFSAAGLDGPSSRTVALRVTDDLDASSIDTSALTVANVAPEASFAAPSSITYGDAVTVAFTNPFDPSTVDTTAGFRYAFGLNSAALALVTYATGDPSATDSFLLDAGTYTIYARIIDKDDGFTQYQAEVTVTPATLTVDVDDAAWEIRTPFPTFTGTISGEKNNESFTAVYSSVADETSTVGQYPITAEVSGATLSNYTVVVNEGTLTVTPSQVQIDIRRESLNLDSNGAISLLIFGSASFDVSLVDLNNFAFAGVEISLFQRSFADMDGDGNQDLLMHFRMTDELRQALEDIYAGLLLEDAADDGSFSSKQNALLALDGFFGQYDQEFRGSDSVDIFLAGKSLRDFLQSLGIG